MQRGYYLTKCEQFELPSWDQCQWNHLYGCTGHLCSEIHKNLEKRSPSLSGTKSVCCPPSYCAQPLSHMDSQVPTTQIDLERPLPLRSSTACIVYIYSYNAYIYIYTHEILRNYTYMYINIVWFDFVGTQTNSRSRSLRFSLGIFIWGFFLIVVCFHAHLHGTPDNTRALGDQGRQTTCMNFSALFKSPQAVAVAAVACQKASRQNAPPGSCPNPPGTIWDMGQRKRRTVLPNKDFHHLVRA